MTNLKGNIFAKYIAILIGIVCGWIVLTLRQDPHFSALIQEGADVALTIAVATWAGACVTHFTLTGDPSPVAPQIAAEHPYASPVVQLVPGQVLQTVLVDPRDLDPNKPATVSPIDARPADVPAPPPAPAMAAA